jgi:hypothetical protein
MAKYLWVLLFIFSCMTIKAQKGKIDTDRPDQTESSVTVPKNYFQAELGFNKENTYDKNYDLLYPTALLKYGFKKFELRLETTVHSSYEHLIPDPKWTNGFDPVEIGFKAALWEEKKGIPKTSIIAGTAIPTLASKNFQADHWAPFFRFTMQNSLTHTIALGYNLGAEWDGFSNTPAWLYTFAPGFELGEKWYAYIEAFGFIKKNEAPQHSLDGGIAYYISPDVKIDLSGGFGISEAAPKNYVAIGFSFRFSMKKNEK